MCVLDAVLISSVLFIAFSYIIITSFIYFFNYLLLHFNELCFNRKHHVIVLHHTAICVCVCITTHNPDIRS